jgi:hypothetical protein
MTGTDLDKTTEAVTHVLGCDERYGTLDPALRRQLEVLLDECGKEQQERRAIAGSKAPVGPSRE